MKFVFIVFAIFIAIIDANMVSDSGIIKVFGQLEHFGGQPYTLLGSVPIDFTYGCHDAHVQRFITFPRVSKGYFRSFGE